MKQKHIVGGILVLAAGLAVVALIKSRGAASAADEDEPTPTVVSVQTGVLKPATLHRYVTGYGTVEPAPATANEAAAGATLAAPSAGVVVKVNVIAGQRVKKGDVLLELNSGAETFDYAMAEVARQKKLYAEQNTSLKDLQDAEAQLDSLRVTAPLSGAVTRINVKPGEAVDVNTAVAEVMDLDRLAVRAEIPAADAVDLKSGEPAEVPVDPPVTASLTFVSPAVDGNNGTVLTYAALPAGVALRPGQFVPLRVVTAVHTNCLAAPEEAVVTDESGKSVIALVKGDEAVQTRVTTGLREDGWVEVKAPGLKAGDIVVTIGAYGLPEKTKIQAVNSSGDETAATDSQSSQAQ